MRTLHITNGDSAAEIIKQSAVPGDVLPWRDPMHHGPFPEGHSLRELGPVRAKYLAGSKMDLAEVERDFELRDAHLRAAVEYERVVLWFEHDLLDQLQILQVLDWFSREDLNTTVLEMICIDDHPEIENFRGIGQLSADQMARLFDDRRAVSTDALSVAARGWGAFCSADPRPLLDFSKSNLSELPFLKSAVLRHFEEFPDADTGLSRTEHQLLALLAEKDRGPVDLFIQNMEFETALFIGDWPTYSTLETLCEASLVSCSEGRFWHPPYSQDQREAFRKQRLSLTDAGRRVLSRETDAFALLDRDIWLGGVHLRSGASMWVWDTVKKCFVERVT